MEPCGGEFAGTGEVGPQIGRHPRGGCFLKIRKHLFYGCTASCTSSAAETAGSPFARCHFSKLLAALADASKIKHFWEVVGGGCGFTSS